MPPYKKAKLGGVYEYFTESKVTSDPDPYQSQDPDPHQNDMDPKHWFSL